MGESGLEEESKDSKEMVGKHDDHDFGVAETLQGPAGVLSCTGTLLGCYGL